MARENFRICAITAAMCDGTGLSDFAKEFPERFFDVGIAEEHALTFASGLAKSGMIPVVALYSSFLQRGYDQLIHDIAIQGLKVIVCVDRAGFTGEDGETHHGLFDVSFLNAIPGATIYSPVTFAGLKSDLKKAAEGSDGLYIIRYPKGGEPIFDAENASAEDYRLVGTGKADTAIIVFGRWRAGV